MSHLSFHIQLIFKILWLALAKDQCINGRNNDSHFMKYLYGGDPKYTLSDPGGGQRDLLYYCTPKFFRSLSIYIEGSKNLAITIICFWATLHFQSPPEGLRNMECSIHFYRGSCPSLFRNHHHFHFKPHSTKPLLYCDGLNVLERGDNNK